MTTTATRPALNTYDLVTLKFEADPEASYLAKQLVDATGKSRTSVSDSLKKLAEAGVVIRMDKDGVALWSLTPTRKAAIKRAAKKAAAVAAAKTTTSVAGVRTKALSPKLRKAVTSTTKGRTVTDTADAEDRTPTGRRLKKAVDFEIRGWYEANNNEPAGSYGVAKGIEARSGTVYVALRRMTNEGKATLVSEGPDRYVMNFGAEAWNPPTE